MLVVMQEGAAEEQIQKVIDRLVEMGFTVHRSTGVLHTVLGGVGPADSFDPADFEAMEGVKECHRIVSQYKLASRHFKPAGTVIKIKNVEIGGKHVVTMAGPCSVESASRWMRWRTPWLIRARRSCAAVLSSLGRRPTVFRAWGKKD